MLKEGRIGQYIIYWLSDPFPYFAIYYEVYNPETCGAIFAYQYVDLSIN